MMSAWMTTRIVSPTPLSDLVLRLTLIFVPLFDGEGLLDGCPAPRNERSQACPRPEQTSAETPKHRSDSRSCGFARLDGRNYDEGLRDRPVVGDRQIDLSDVAGGDQLVQARQG